MIARNTKRPETWAKRFALNLKTTEEIRSKIEERAKRSGRSITLEIEQQLIRSFETEDKEALNEVIKNEMRGTIAALEDKISIIRKHEQLLRPDESARNLGEAFALALIAAQQQFGQNWRESGSVVALVVNVMRDVMTELGRPGAEFDTLPNRARIDEATSNIAKSIVETFAATMPPLPEIERSKQQNPITGRTRLVTTFKDKATGAVLDTFTSREFNVIDPSDRPKSSPEYFAALDKYRPRRESIDVEECCVYALEDGGSVWDTFPEAETTPPKAEPAARFATPEELAKAVPAENHPKELFGEHDFRQALGPDRDGDATPDPVEPASAPTKRKKAKAGA